VPDEPDLPASAREQRELLAGLRAVVEAKDAENAMLRAELAAERELRRRLELRIAEQEGRLGMDSTNSGTPTSKEPLGASTAWARSARATRTASGVRGPHPGRRGGRPGHAPGPFGII